MNADEAQMNADKGAESFVPLLARSCNQKVFICGHLRFICVHLRFPL
jgi:hypothetical protein